MLKEMRDAAGDSSEFYTPRAVVRFMVTVTDPRLGELVLDPTCGTGGFLTECYACLEKQYNTAKDRHTLQNKSIVGGQAKSLTYLLAQMNLLLYRMEYGRSSTGDSLEVKLSELCDRDRVDVIPPTPFWR